MTGHPCNVTLSGLAVSPGLAVGQAFVYRDILHDLERYDIGTHQVEYEHGRIERAVEKVLADLGLSAERVEAELNTDLALIFRAHEAMLRDPALTKDLRGNWSKSWSMPSKWSSACSAAGSAGSAR